MLGKKNKTETMNPQWERGRNTLFHPRSPWWKLLDEVPISIRHNMWFCIRRIKVVKFQICWSIVSQNRWIGWNCPNPWPVRSPNPTPMDFYFKPVGDENDFWGKYFCSIPSNKRHFWYHSNILRKLDKTIPRRALILTIDIQNI